LQQVCKDGGLTLSTEQQNLVMHIASSQDQFLAVQGLAGTGKTYALNAAREVLEKNGYEVKGMSATGQAAEELGKDANIKDCTTIHRALNQAERAAGNAILGEDYANKSKWNFKGLKTAGKPTVRFVDEASLTDNNLLLQTQQLALARGEKLVLIGDDRQLPPVGTGNAYANLVQSGKIRTATLTDIRRQSNLELREAVREAVSGDIKKSLEMVGKDIQEVPSRIRRLNAVAKAYSSQNIADQGQSVVLTATNKDRTELNQRIRKNLIKQGQLTKGQKFAIQTGKEMLTDRYFSEGDKVVFFKNDTKLGVKNGTQGNVIKLTGEGLQIQTKAGKMVNVDMKAYNHIDHGYCVTSYKAQGSTVKRAFIHMDSKNASLNSRNAYYVNVSRAKENVSLFVDNKEKVERQIAEFSKKITSVQFKKMPKTLGNLKMPKISSVLPGPLKIIAKLIELPLQVVGKSMQIAQKAVDIAKKPVELLEKGANIGKDDRSYGKSAKIK
jgi:ATP-dependent exoDNAse (exonuclease V) alpha subunit